MRKKIKFYRAMIVEILETLCTICLYLECEGRRSHNQYTSHMRSHFDGLKGFSEELRCEKIPKRNVTYTYVDFLKSEGKNADD